MKFSDLGLPGVEIAPAPLGSSISDNLQNGKYAPKMNGAHGQLQFQLHNVLLMNMIPIMSDLFIFRTIISMRITVLKIGSASYFE